MSPAGALVFNALVWGTSWWPMRQFAAHGLHPLWATAIIYLVVVAVLLVATPRALAQVLRTPALWVLMLAAGATNATFNWAMVVGDVVRVVLLFYLMPLWTVLLARLLLHEPVTRHAAMRVTLALLGAAVVLWPAGSGLDALPLPRSLPDWLGLVGGVAFALNNVMLRREARRSEAGLSMAMFLGGAVVCAPLAAAMAASGAVPWPLPPQSGWAVGVLVMAALYLAGNLSLQYGAARLPANVTSVVMLTEVVFAAGSALVLGGGELTAQLLLGGGLILGAALMSAFGRDAAH
ncbi:MAG: DMT family transporter [Bacteriovorax sp.]|nr:DMT family transporter [Rhizobacter sp.]